MHLPARPDVIRSRRVVLPDGVRPASILLEAGRVRAVAAHDAAPAGSTVADAGDAVVMPGVVDTHVHVNEPGRTEWEGFRTATRAAAAGGATTLVDMPLNSVPATTSLAALRAKRQAASQGPLQVDVGFWGGVVPDNVEELKPMAADGALGFKCFLVESGVDEFAHVHESDLERAMPRLAEIGAPLLVHAELPGPIEEASRRLAGRDRKAYATYLASRPRAAEDEAIRLVTRLVRATRARTHVVHHSSADSLDLLRAAKAEGLPLSAETCPHYLTFVAEEIADGDTPFKCAPPIRERENRERLWEALRDGVLEMIASDHSPCAPALKRMESGDFVQAWGGISGLQLALPVVWTEAARRGHDLRDLARWMCEATARLAGLSDRKGRIAPGLDADFVVWHPEASFRVEPRAIHHRHDVTPYAGRTLLGVVEATFLRGEKVYDRDGGFAEPRGGTLTRGR